MRNRTPRLIATCLLSYFLAGAEAQDPSVHDMKVELHGQPEIILFGYFVTLQDIGRRTESSHATVESGDTFTFRRVPAGDYMARVFDASGALVREEMIRVGGGSSIVRIEMEQVRVARPAGSRVSVRQLQNPPSRKAVQAFVAAQKYSAAGKPEKAAEELEKAIRISPAFAEAYTNLAAMHLKMRQYEHTVEESTRAMQIGSPNIIDLCNRALAEWALARYDDAIRSAEQALRLDGSAETAHFVLGSLLIDDRRTLREGIRHLERVTGRHPAAARNLERARTALAAQ